MPDKTRVAGHVPPRSKKKRPRRRFSVLRLLVVVFLLLLFCALGTGVGFMAEIVEGLPPLETIGVPQPVLTSFVYSSDGVVLAELHKEQNRIAVDIDTVPKHVQNAVVAIEDDTFWEHIGFDLKAIARAIYVDLVTRSFAEGASTITQQLVKNAFVGTEKTIPRKVQEVILAVEVERRFTKKEILEMYINLAFFGHDAYGIEAAAQTYFGKHASELSIAEGAMLAGLLKSPNAYSPYVDINTAVSRRNLVIRKMVENGFITEEQAEAAKKERVRLAGLKRGRTYKAPHFVDYVLDQLLEKYGPEKVYEGGLEVYTTLDYRIQGIAEEAVKKVLDPVYPLDEGVEQPEAAAVVLDPHTGYIRAMVGGRSHERARSFNRAVQAYRQPGSAFKPIIAYAPAIEKGYTTASIIDDSPVVYVQWNGETWVPQNYDSRYRGLTTLREGLRRSVNVVAVKLLDKIGIETGIEYAQRMGISSLVLEGPENDLHLPIALGGLTRGVSPLELTSAYGTFCNQGVHMEPLAILKVVDRHGNVLEENEPKGSMAVSPETAYIMNDMLKTVVNYGTGTAARLPDRPAAGKTGTTTDRKDAWFVGYTPDLACGVWMGYDQPRRMEGVWGGTYAAPIWKEIMTKALEAVPASDFPKPDGIVEGVPVCTKSGMRPGELCPPECIRNEIFARGTQPRHVCNVHVKARMCQASNLLATPYCPEDQVVEKVFIKRPEPYTPYVDEKGRTYIPEDAALEVPTEECNVHALPEPPIEPGGERPEGEGGTGPGLTGEQDGEAGAVEFNVEAKRYAFIPGLLTVKLGDEVIINVTSSDVEHGITIPAFNVKKRIPAGETVTVRFVADKAGVFPFYCHVNCGPGSRRHVGQLVVEK